jgi:5-methylcytosine-specific restriction enzyme subunit McrC
MATNNQEHDSEPLQEYDSRVYTDEQLPKRARDGLRQHINTKLATDNKKKTRLQLQGLEGSKWKIKATQYVGIVSLRGGPTISIRPKVPADLFELIQYTRDIRTNTIPTPTTVETGREFVDAIARLFQNELEHVLTQGLARSYRRVSETTDHVRGRIDVPRQIRRHGPKPTKFECTYDKLTVDTTLNRAILYATVLLRCLSSKGISKQLRQHEHSLRQQVTLTPIRPIELQQISLSRLRSHYEHIITITQSVLEAAYIENLRAGEQPTFGLLINMNRLFEDVVAKAVAEALEPHGWEVIDDHTCENLLSNGPRTITTEPDLLARNQDRQITFVGDAKYKTEGTGKNIPRPDDVYQAVSYQLTHDVPGILFYPRTESTNGRNTYDVQNIDDSLSVVHIPLKKAGGKSIEETIGQEISEQLEAILCE